MRAVDAVEWVCVLCSHCVQNDWVEQCICIKFCVKLEPPSAETIRMIQKVTAMGSWWLAASSRQRACSCITSHAECFGETSNDPDDAAPLQPRFGTLWLLDFPQTKTTFGKEEISGHWWDSRKYDGAAERTWENCVRSQGAYLEGDWGIIVLCTLFLVSCTFFNRCTKNKIFHIICLDTFWTDLVYVTTIKSLPPSKKK